MTASRYAGRKGWALEGTAVDVRHQAGRGVVEVTLSLRGDLSREQETRLRTVARRCTVHRMLAGGVEIVER